MPTTRLKDKAIAVPDDVLDALGLSEGDEFELVVRDGFIVLKPREEVVERHPDIDAALEEGLRDIEEGRVTPAFASAKEFEVYRRTEAYRKLLESD